MKKSRTIKTKTLIPTKPLWLTTHLKFPPCSDLFLNNASSLLHKSSLHHFLRYQVKGLGTEFPFKAFTKQKHSHWATNFWRAEDSDKDSCYTILLFCWHSADQTDYLFHFTRDVTCKFKPLLFFLRCLMRKHWKIMVRFTTVEQKKGRTPLTITLVLNNEFDIIKSNDIAFSRRLHSFFFNSEADEYLSVLYFNVVSFKESRHQPLLK